MGEIASLAIGSLAGGFARYFIGGAVQRFAGGDFPYGTLLVNLSGCLLVGLLHGLAAGRLPLGAEARALLFAGFCGAFTTFSTLVLDSSLLAESGKGGHAFLNLAASVLLGLALFRLGAVLGEARWLPGTAAEDRPAQVDG